ncbi:MAG: hypothetical protein A3B25_00495 [Candidatus Ryanbacteria bacterium RIFCSPLOWO2_01_FULL_48_26]|uniref:Pseudouridine synthase RsuA/RluA-like domain-containing protein n=1 Tax=Candidatus Ryanbacteria bacterium RIFCSPLOWO2_01_FULL_48_26 TaxID=1802126 RepID=A0A1G2GTL3_9BACT|nr:MAG: hypothetical protein A3B25_00495 [Candidatus Ryanbacteria bacterium RIFCSPLOWO2_01_FULL_48_26]
MIEPEIIYEDENFLAVNKPAGLLVHSTQSRVKSQKSKVSESTLVDWLIKKYPEVRNVGDKPEERPGIVHRLDKGTSGIMVVAKNQKYFEYLKALFNSRQIKKKYIALLWGKVVPEEGVIEKPIGIKDGTIKRSVHSQKMVKDAVTRYRVMRYVKSQKSPPKAGPPSAEKVKSDAPSEVFSLVEVEPLTGRTHQIRVHMASIGHPILGDMLYGSKTSKHVKTCLMLHASSLEFTGDDGKRLRFQADPPADYLETLRNFEAG